jgi:uncharacterized protein YjdB
LASIDRHVEEIMSMGRFAAFAFSVGVLAAVYVAACVLPGEPLGAERIVFQLDSTLPYRVPLAGTAEPTIGITAGGQPLSNPHYRLESLDGAVVRVDPTGRALEGMARGTASVRVIYQTAAGTPDTTFTVRVVVSRVAVNSASLAFTRLADTSRLTATAYDAKDVAVPNLKFTWSSAEPQVASVDTAGLVRAVNEGTVAITAEADSVTGSSSVSVTQVAAAVRMVPKLDTLRTVSRSTQFLAVALDDMNGVIRTAKPHWSSSNESVARIDTTGLATATGAGTAKIIARVGTAADTAIMVVAQVVRFMVVKPSFDTLTAIADTLRHAALAFDSLNFPIPRPTVEWATGDTAVATVDATGLVRATRNGVVLVTASAAGLSAFATIVVDQQVAAAQLSTDRVTLVGEGDTVRLSTLGLDKNGYPVHTQANPLGFAWSVWHSGSGCVASLPGSEAPEGFSTLVTARGAGETFIIAAPYTAIGLGRPDTATVTVTGAPAGEAEIAYRSNWGIQALCAVGGARTVLIWAVDLNHNYERLYDFWGPAWSPDGARLAFYGLLWSSQRCGLYVARADGSDVQQISDRCAVSDGYDRPAWSPDGTRLAVSPANTDNSDQDTIYVVNADGSNVRPLFSFSPVRRVANSTWSPDGTQLAFDVLELSDSNYIYVMNADGSGAHSLRNTAGGRSPAWSPDGSQLAFGRSDEPGQSDIWLINPDGSGATNLTQGNAAFAMTPAWSPDGSRLVFEGRINLESNTGHLFVINRDGTGLQQLDTGDDAPMLVSGPTWRRRP